MKKRYDLETPDLTPDLEWMLSSGQVSSSLLLEKLLQDYFSKIYQIAYSILDDRALARQCTHEIFVNAILSSHRFSSETGVEIWLYQIAWRQCLKVHRRLKTRLVMVAALSSNQKTNPSDGGIPRNSLDDVLWQGMLSLDESSRWMLILHILQGWSAETISKVVDAPIQDIQTTLDSAWGIMVDRWMMAGQEEPEFAAALSHWFASRWPPPDPGEKELDELSASIIRHISKRRSRIKPYVTIMEVALLALVVLAAGGFLFWAGWGEDTQPTSKSIQAVAVSSPTPTPVYHGRPTNTSILMPRGFHLTPQPTPSPTPAGVLYGSQKGEDLGQIASRLDVSLDDLRQLNRIAGNETNAHGQILYIPGSLPTLTPRLATPVPAITDTLPLETPVSSQEIFRLMYPENQIFNTVWFDAILFMRPQLPFSGLQDILRIQLWLSEDQALLLGGALKNDPEEILLWASDMNYTARPGEGNPWFEPVNNDIDEMNIDLRLLYGAVALLKSGYSGQEYQFIGEEQIAGRQAWKIMELDDKMTPMAEISLDKETGFVLKYRRDPSYPLDRESRAYLPQEAMITAIEFDVDFPQELFSPRLPWRGGYAWDPSGKPFQVPSAP